MSDVNKKYGNDTNMVNMVDMVTKILMQPDGRSNTTVNHLNKLTTRMIVNSITESHYDVSVQTNFRSYLIRRSDVTVLMRLLSLEQIQTWRDTISSLSKIQLLNMTHWKHSPIDVFLEKLRRFTLSK